MLKGRYNLFCCDTCCVEAYAKVSPTGWFWVKGGMDNPPGHACEECAAGISDDIKGKMGQKYPVSDKRNSNKE